MGHQLKMARKNIKENRSPINKGQTCGGLVQVEEKKKISLKKTEIEEFIIFGMMSAQFAYQGIVIGRRLFYSRIKVPSLSQFSQSQAASLQSEGLGLPHAPLPAGHLGTTKPSHLMLFSLPSPGPCSTSLPLSLLLA